MRPIKTVVAIPRPGCGSGGLQWATVRPVIEPILESDRYVIVDRAGGTT